jgi:Carboxypeptidase regulatory-like domain
MHMTRQLRHLPLGLCVCSVIVGVAASTVSSCSKSATAVGPDSGKVTGTISSSQGGPLADVDVTATDANDDGFTSSTDGFGTYLIPDVPAGAVTVTLTQLPSNCTTPAAQDATVSRGKTTTVPITVTCTP